LRGDILTLFDIDYYNVCFLCLFLCLIFECVNDKRAERDQKVGDLAPLAHQDTRAFPDWYKPYTFNYSGDGYLILFFSGLLVAGYSYTSDICEQKGRRSRKVFDSDLPSLA
jgi:hypothetical protein